METGQATRQRHLPRKLKLGLLLGCGILAMGVIGLAAFPVGLLREVAERRLSSRLEAPVQIGSLSRREPFSFSPEIVAADIRIGQPEWAGDGDFLKIDHASARIPILSLLTGGPALKALRISGMNVALVRDADGRSNWAGRPDKGSGDGSPMKLAQLTIEKSRFSLRDARRRLDLSGTLAADARNGLTIDARGSFNGAAARLSARGGALAGANQKRDWPFTARLASDPLDLDIRGTMASALDTRDMRLTMRARGTSLKQLDYIIEAGLFGTQNIDLTGDVRRKGGDWIIDRLDGKIGRSRLHASATITKRDGRTKIDAKIDAPQFDFDDLADDAGLAAARAEQKRVGKRVIPATRINLGKMGPTDGVIRFSIANVLVKGGSAFRSLKGDLTLDHRVLTLENAVAGLEAGSVRGWVKVDSTQTVPTLSTELRIEGTSFDTLVGQPDMIRGPLRGLVRLTGRGDTIRDAFARGDGKIAFVAESGAMNKAAAFVLGRDLGGAIRQKLGDGNDMASLRCAILVFQAKRGVLTPAPLAIDTEISRGDGRGQINLDGETIALAMNGTAKGKAALKLVDPIRIGGTLSNPVIAFDAQNGRSSKDAIFGAIGRSVGSALGLRKDQSPPPAPPVDCRKLARTALN